MKRIFSSLSVFDSEMDPLQIKKQGGHSERYRTVGVFFPSNSFFLMRKFERGKMPFAHKTQGGTLKKFPLGLLFENEFSFGLLSFKDDFLSPESRVET